MVDANWSRLLDSTYPGLPGLAAGSYSSLLRPLGPPHVCGPETWIRADVLRPTSTTPQHVALKL